MIKKVALFSNFLPLWLSVDILVNNGYTGSYMINTDEKEYFTTAEVAGLLGKSRVAIFQKIKLGLLPAKRSGRRFLVAKKDLKHLLSAEPTARDRQIIGNAVKKTIADYGETLRLLGKE